MIIPRDTYLRMLVDRQWNGMVKIVTGIRRCGKSFLLFDLFRNHLVASGTDARNIIEVRLENASFKKYRDPEKLAEHILETASGTDMRYYVLIDEIQMVDDFESTLNELLAHRNLDVYVTGSNSKFLSKDIVTEFRGRGDEIHMFPLSFREFYGFRGGNQYEAWREYLYYGGLPEVVKLPDDEQRSKFLDRTVRTVYLRDVIERNGITSEDALDDVTDILFSSIGSLTNPNRIAATFNSKGNPSVDKGTVKKYIESLCDAYLFERSERYDVKGKAYINHLYKYYAVDTGIRNARIRFRQAEDLGHLMENVIYNELRSRGFEVDVGVVRSRVTVGQCDIDKDTFQQRTMTMNYEIDFIAFKGVKRYYIQSAYRMDDRSKIDAETRPLNGARDNFRKIVIVGDDIPRHVDDKGINYIGVFEFLLDTESLEKM